MTLFYRNLLLFIFIELFAFESNAHQECRRFIQPNSCNYYLCEEMNHSFGVRGYFIGFGDRKSVV